MSARIWGLPSSKSVPESIEMSSAESSSETSGARRTDFFFFGGALDLGPLASRKPSRRPGFFADDDESDFPADPDVEFPDAVRERICPERLRPQFGQFFWSAAIRVPHEEQFMASLSDIPRS